MRRNPKVKEVLGGLPLAAELDWVLRGKGAPVGGFNLEELRAALPDWASQAAASPLRKQKNRKVLFFATLHYWLSHAALLGLALVGLGNRVSLAYLPYSNWHKPVDKYDLRRRDLYLRDVFKPAAELIDLFSFVVGRRLQLPEELSASVDQISVMDCQYTLQVEDVDLGSALFKLRQARNKATAGTALRWLIAERPDVVIVPNGLILEFGAVFHAAGYLGIPVVSYEFGEQRDRIWLAQDSSVMLQNTGSMWMERRSLPFEEAQRKQVEELFSTRQKAGLFRNFYRRWQDVPSQGVEKLRIDLGLDQRPIVLLAANVIGDSLTLGRATFSGDMSTWLRRTLDYFAAKPDVQLVVRVHPGERNLDGPSVADLVSAVFPALPKHIRVVYATDPVNTYDLVAAADLGIVYTTTVGLEMVMSGLPAIVAGNTHYRGKGFTLDPTSWDEYFEILDHALLNLRDISLSTEQIDTAWHYAYRFFFDFPQPFPWHLLHFWEDSQNFSLARLFTTEGQAQYGRSFNYLMGEPIDWKKTL